jgi:hypothetical protein
VPVLQAFIWDTGPNAFIHLLPQSEHVSKFNQRISLAAKKMSSGMLLDYLG